MRYAKNMLITGSTKRGSILNVSDLREVRRGSALTANVSGEVKRGSALIMVMLVIASITTIIFATQRIALVQFSQSVREEDNLTAYYSAKAGIEDGLVRYRFNKNVETSMDKKFRHNLSSANFPTKAEKYEIDSSTGIEDGVNGDYDPKFQYYDLVISYKTKRINVDNTTGDFNFSSSSEIAVDKRLDLSGFPYSSTQYFLRYGFKFVGDSTVCANATVTLQQVIDTDTGLVTSGQQIVKYDSPNVVNGVYDSSSNANNLLIRTEGVSSVSTVRIRSFGCPVQYGFTTSTSNDGKGIDSNTGPEFDSLTTEILSTGYFGSAKRTLIASVDRQTGNLIGVFDFILYSGGNTGTIDRAF